MLYTFAPSTSSCFPFPTNPIKIPNSDLHHFHLHSFPLSSSSSSHIATEIVYSLSAIDKEQNNNQNHRNPHHHHINDEEDDDTELFNRFYESSPIYLNDRRRRNNNRQIIGDEIKESLNIEKVGSSSSSISISSSVNLANMWWTDIKAALGQRINVEGLMFSVSVITKHRNWVIPHVSVADIRHIDWAALRRKGFEGVVFDKDNTLTVPYSLALFGPIASSVESCKSVFGNNIAVFSNSAGLEEYDPDGRKARALEYVIGIRVIRHSKSAEFMIYLKKVYISILSWHNLSALLCLFILEVKKPAGSAEEIERHFGCDSSKLIMVGDRPFTDIVYGNRNGFLTILTAPLSLAEEPFIVKQVRKIELALVNRWSKKGLKPANERLLSDVSDCVKELPPV
ncbi:hypothetical protein OSB04_018060 [Centaurea solstitialis]|uniref:Haloacid dehalogenase superfamily protein n=1 Tax=Centaurea solstitialis TaxID=347529 RepID=A0AA38WIY8_9ASTR|nr:hypothetical protein OSB04_018060 [Centaurea solstitialis]